ncbi:MAG: hypothetical protein ACJ78T_02120, partial [Myxococcales bacterium]
MLLIFAGMGTLGGATAAAQVAGGAHALIRGIAVGVGLGVLSVALLRITSERVLRSLVSGRRSDREVNQKARLLYVA